MEPDPLEQVRVKAAAAGHKAQAAFASARPAAQPLPTRAAYPALM